MKIALTLTTQHFVDSILDLGLEERIRGRKMNQKIINICPGVVLAMAGIRAQGIRDKDLWEKCEK